MPEYLICEGSPMGGANIVAVCANFTDAMTWVRAHKGRKFYVYQQVFSSDEES